MSALAKPVPLDIIAEKVPRRRQSVRVDTTVRRIYLTHSLARWEHMVQVKVCIIERTALNVL